MWAKFGGNVQYSSFGPFTSRAKMTSPGFLAGNLDTLPTVTQIAGYRSAPPLSLDIGSGSVFHCC